MSLSSDMQAYSDFKDYEGDPVLVLAGRNVGKNREDACKDSNIIGNDSSRALLPVAGKKCIERILEDMEKTMPIADIPKTIVIGDPNETELVEIVESFNNPQIEMIPQGINRWENIFRGIDHILKPYNTRACKELYEDHIESEQTKGQSKLTRVLNKTTQYIKRINGNNDNFKPRRFSRRGREVSVDLFASLAYKIVQYGKKQGKEAAINQAKAREFISETIDQQLIDHMLPAPIQRYLTFGTDRLKKRFEQYKEKQIQRVLNHRLLTKGTSVAFKDRDTLKEFHDYYLNKNTGFYLTTGDWPFHEQSVLATSEYVNNNNRPSFTMFLGDRAGIEPFHLIDPEYKGPLNFKFHGPEIDGFDETYCELQRQTKFANIWFIKPNKVKNGDLIQKIFSKRKATSSTYYFELANALKGEIAKLMFNPEGSKGYWSGIHYPVMSLFHHIKGVYDSWQAYKIEHRELTQPEVFYNNKKRQELEKKKAKLTKRLSADYLADHFAPLLRCNFKATYIPFGTISLDMDRTKEHYGQKVCDNNNQEVNPIDQHYDHFKAIELQSARDGCIKRADAIIKDLKDNYF